MEGIPMTDGQTTTHAELFDLTGKSALVTGGSRGIGMMMARGLLQAGVRFVGLGFLEGQHRELSSVAIRRAPCPVQEISG